VTNHPQPLPPKPRRKITIARLMCLVALIAVCLAAYVAFRALNGFEQILLVLSLMVLALSFFPIGFVILLAWTIFDWARRHQLSRKPSEAISPDEDS
jgi:Na+/proline symporter